MSEDLVRSVRIHAESHYNDSYIWSVIVEAKTDAELLEELDGMTSLAAALAHFTSVGEILDDRIADGRNSAF